VVPAGAVAAAVAVSSTGAAADARRLEGAMPPAEVLEAVLDRTGYLTELAASTDPQDESRVENLSELVERAYEDAYRQFIEPVVGASGEQLARARAPIHRGEINHR